MLNTVKNALITFTSDLMSAIVILGILYIL